MDSVNLSKSQVDRLGERLKEDALSEEDLRMLDQYRRTFADAYNHVIATIRDRLGLEPTGRPAKSTTSIREKLRRESIRLSQIQDTAGCRIVAEDIAGQDKTVARLSETFPIASPIDRREKPSHGYRAVHVVARVGDKIVEIQVRTLLQHKWAEVSEKLADIIDPSIKYGGGPQAWAADLRTLSAMLADIENDEQKLSKRIDSILESNRSEETRKAILDLQLERDEHRKRLLNEFDRIIMLLIEKKKG